MDITDVCEECFSCYWFVSNNDEYECSGCEEPCEEYLDMNRKKVNLTADLPERRGDTRRHE